MSTRSLYAAVAVLMFVVCCGVQAQVVPARTPVVLTATQQARYMALLPGLRCMQCQNESLAASQAPLAQDMRYKIRQLIARGESDAQVRQYLVDRYGEYVLYKPRFEPLTWLLWLGPALFLLVALAVCWRLLAVLRARREPVRDTDTDALRRLLEDDR